MTNRDEFLYDNVLLRTLFEQSEAGTLIIDRQGKIILVNKRIELITGYTTEEIEGNLSWKDFIIEEDQVELMHFLQMLNIAEGNRPERIEINFKNKHKQLCTALLSAFSVPEKSLIVMSIIDITDQKKSEIQLQEAKEIAENSERLKTEFLANMSHEIRTPINGIVGFADLLKIEDLNEEKKSLYIDQVVHGSHDLLLLIEKIISISRLDSNQVKLNQREFPLNRKLREIESKFKEELIIRAKENVKLSFLPGNQNEDYQIVGDPLRLNEVISNLLENAVKFTDVGRIEFGYYQLEEDGLEAQPSLLFFVKDSGSGIDKTNKKVIFDRFVKVIEKEETIYKGAGLGLSIAKEIVQLFKGSIWAESTKGDGSRFFFTFPIGKVKEKANVIPEDLSRQKDKTDWADKEILIAEDVESNYLFIKELLGPTKVKMLRARDGQEAIDLFDANPHIDIVVMDILMPGMDGYEATTEIRKRNPNIPVIAQSAFTFEGDIQNGLYAGYFNDYIMKPYTRKVLLAVISKYFTS